MFVLNNLDDDYVDNRHNFHTLSNTSEHGITALLWTTVQTALRVTACSRTWATLTVARSTVLPTSTAYHYTVRHARPGCFMLQLTVCIVYKVPQKVIP